MICARGDFFAGAIRRMASIGYVWTRANHVLVRGTCGSGSLRGPHRCAGNIPYSSQAEQIQSNI